MPLRAICVGLAASDDFLSTPKNRHRHHPSACPKGANNGLAGKHVLRRVPPNGTTDHPGIKICCQQFRHANLFNSQP
jgi:hypothetical protein